VSAVMGLRKIEECGLDWRTKQMPDLVSPEYNFEIFCNHMLGKDLMDVMDCASAEIGYARRFHREATKDSDFRKGSKGRVYCDDLQKLISMLMNGAVPNDSSPEFLVSVKPLILGLLKKWDIGNLRQVFSNLQTPERNCLPSNIDPLVLVISSDEVKKMDTSAALSVLNRLIESPNTTREFIERVDICFHGYDHTPQELFEIPEVRNFVYQLDSHFPFWFYFLSKRHLGLQCLLLCFVPPFLTDDARSTIFPERINKLCSERWVPALNHICKCVGFSEDQIHRLMERGRSYIVNGRFPIDSERFIQ